ncbi:hypothetical protein RJ641_009935 [Dillenia turbinata]|uniref:Uncharacterized protein n=1 Tax=Dillenia turbinata TaxID=194707 RepID=A0AAN8UXK6_9MAGN
MGRTDSIATINPNQERRSSFLEISQTPQALASITQTKSSAQAQQQRNTTMEGFEVEVAVVYSKRAQWLRAGVLGAKDGLLSTASLMMGVGAV